MAIIEIAEGAQCGRRYELSGERLMIGRNDDSDLQISDASISRRHAVLTMTADGWVMEDTGSQNGMHLKGERVNKICLKNGMLFSLGNVMLRFIDGADQVSRKDATPLPSGSEERPSEVPDISGIRKMSDIYPRIEAQFGRVIVGQRNVLEEIMIAIAADAHCLMIGLPGLAKTLMVSTLSKILQLSFRRIQFTPDLMPSDILGTEVLDINETSGEKSFRFIKGPVFTNMLLADEINRTPPKTQAALLESMQEKQVTIANETFALPRPFFVLATQNPLEQEGTYPLPEAQLDRFMFNITVAYPSAEEEASIVTRTTSEAGEQPKEILGADDLLQLQRLVRTLPVSPHVVKYATALVRATRPGDASAPGFIREHIHCGAGPRAAQYLVLGAKARAVVHGRVNVSCEDIRKLALPVIRHRLFTNFTADSEGITPDDLITRLVETVEEPMT